MARPVFYQALAFVAAVTTPALGFAGDSNANVLVRPLQAAQQQFSTAVLATTAGLPTTSNWRQQPVNPEIFATPFPVGAQQYVAHTVNPIVSPNFAQGIYPQPPDLFAKPFPVQLQQYDATPWQGMVPSPVTPRGWQGYQFEIRFAIPFPATAQQYDATPWQGAVPTAPTPQGFYPQPPDVFAKAFPAIAQQYDATGWRGLVPTPATPHGWEGQQLEWRLAAPFPVTAQQFRAFEPLGTIVTAQPEGWRSYEYSTVFAKPFPAHEQQYVAHTLYLIATPAPVRGWYGQQLEFRFVKHVPAHAQQFAAFQPRGFIGTSFIDGFRGHQWDLAFRKPYPVTEQPYTTAPSPLNFPPNLGWWGYQYNIAFATPVPVTAQQYFSGIPQPPAPPGFGWWGYQFAYAFATPFPVTAQVFSVNQLVGDVPIIKPPGAGKRYHKPTDYLPEPPVAAKPAKKFRPVWDRPPQGEIEQHPSAQGPVPLPPASLFAAPPQQAGLDPRQLPNFNHLVPDDPLGLAQRLKEAQDRTDAIAVLKALGLV